MDETKIMNTEGPTTGQSHVAGGVDLAREAALAENAPVDAVADAETTTADAETTTAQTDTTEPVATAEPVNDPAVLGEAADIPPAPDAAPAAPDAAPVDPAAVVPNPSNDGTPLL